MIASSLTVNRFTGSAYFWSKWSGNMTGKIARLLPYNWMSHEFQAEAAKLSTRRQLPTRADGKDYARTAAAQSERLLTVMNIQSSAQTVEADLSGVETVGFVELKSGSKSARQTVLRVDPMLRPITVFLLALALGPAVAGQDKPKAHGQAAPTTVKGSRKVASGRELVPKRWWETTPAITRVTLRTKREEAAFPLKDKGKVSAALDDLLARGISALEIFAPAEGGRNFGGLDTINRYRLDPGLGTMDDFRQLVRLAHSKRMAIVTFDNLGYCSVEATDFQKACDDVRAGRDTREVKYFLWSDSADAPAPPGDSVYMIGGKPSAGRWEFSKRAGRYYWTKWGGVDSSGAKVRLPQYNWETREFQEEAERIIRFWMDTGIDGMIIDAVNWYPHYTWEIGRRRITDVVASYGNAYLQPEGAGGFREDPVAWVTEGGWNSVQQYGLGIWWDRKKPPIIQDAVTTGNPSAIEPALRAYHDRVVAAGGVLYYSPDLIPRFPEPAKRHLAVAAASFTGNLVAVGRGLDIDEQITQIFKTKAAHPALHQLSRRRQLPTNANDKYYAMLRTAANGSERILVVMNFQPAAQTVEVDLSGVATTGLVDLRSGEIFSRQYPFKMELPAYGYRLYQVKPAARMP